MATATDQWHKPQWHCGHQVFFHSQFTKLSFPNPICTCWLIWPFHPHGGVSTPPRAWKSVHFTLHPHRGESPLHSKEVLVFNLVLRSKLFSPKGWSPIQKRVGEPIPFNHLATSYINVNILRRFPDGRGLHFCVAIRLLSCQCNQNWARLQLYL